MASSSEKEPPPTPRSKLETLPREDLIRFAKKQAITAKQLREKNEELETKLKELLASPPRPPSIPTSERCVQTDSTEESQLLCRLQEESQWMRMALTTQQRPPEDQISAPTPVPTIDCSTQTAPTPDPVHTSSGTEVHSANVECQTEEETAPPKPVAAPQSQPQPQANPDALREAKMQLQLLATELDEARRQLSSQSLLKLEMEDTERSFAKLQTELSQTSSLLQSAQNENASLSSEIQSLQKRLSSLESEREKAEKKSTESESTMETLRREANLSRLEANELEIELEIKLATAMEELERMKLDTASDASATQRRLCDLQTALDETRRRLEKSENERGLVERQLDELNNEYRAYRTRVHSVLKQERTTSASGADSEDGMSNERRQADQQLINSLREQLEKAKQLYETCRCDLERVREQHDQLYERHRMLRTHADEAEAQWKCELESLRSDAARVARLHAEQVRTLTQDKRDLQRDFERRIEELMADKREKVGTLEQRVAELDRDLTLAKQQLSDYDRRANKSEKDSDAKDERRRGNVELAEFGVSPRPLMERRPGEGAENTDVIKKPSSAVPLGSSDFPAAFDRQRSLEDLLGDQHSIHSFDTSIDRPPKDESATMAAKLRHLTDLLSESEANNSRLSEQIKLLKDEIRRLERNNERSEHVANAEYLKNIVMQFLNPAMLDRRQRLLPVLTTLLRLSPEEVAILKDTAPENQPTPANAAASSGWSGYLHRWSGLN